MIDGEWIARAIHRNQKDKAGNPYIHHVERVVRKVQAGLWGPEVQNAAWLHDVVEDSDLPLRGLTALGFSDGTVNLVGLLTRPETAHTYESYIDRILHSGLAAAIAIKKADIEDHLNPGCPEHLIGRYQAAYLRLCDRIR